MVTEQHSKLIEFIWSIAERLRGPYRPPQYRKVMLPLIVLRRLDMVLEDGKDAVRVEHARLKTQKMSDDTINRTLAEFVRKTRGVSFFNTSPYTFKTLLDDPEGLAANLAAYINAFSPNVRDIFEKFKFEAEIAVLDEKNRLYNIIKEFADPRIDLHPDRVSNLQMGYIFEHLIRRFNEQANEEAGDHFTPREVITLMTHLLYTKDEDVYREHIAKTIYDPACGTGGMLSVSEEYIRSQNPDAHLMLYGQDYNDESWAICCSDMLIKGESVANIALGDTLGDGKSFDLHPEKKFDYMMANPPFGVDWKDQYPHVLKEHGQFGFNGRFGPGLPRASMTVRFFFCCICSPNAARRQTRTASPATARKSPSFLTALPCSQATRGAAKATSGAGSLRATGLRPLWLCRTSFSTIQAFIPISGW
jgi:type I restriction enzyme M protein